eukprot:1588813-Prymnesium_polylepis.2
MLRLMNSNDEGIVPADGSKGNYLSAMKRRIRLGIKELKERKTFLAQQHERKAHFSEITEGLSARAKAMVLEDVERVSQKRRASPAHAPPIAYQPV